MVRKFTGLLLFSAVVLGISACGGTKPEIPVNRESVLPGSSVARGTEQFKLLGNPLSEGNPLPSVPLVDAMTMQEADLSKERGSVLLLSLVPSIDTRVCEAQTHSLGEGGNILPKEVRRITISRDTPFAQKRFATEAKLTHLQYLSDYKQGDFGRSTGLLVDGSMLLARSVILVDKKGIVRYIQVVPDLANLPDMERAFQKATELVKD